MKYVSINPQNPESQKYLAWKQTLVARYPAQEDGQTVWVYATAAPARFYIVRVFAKKGRQGITIKTGSGMGDHAAKIAEQISSGMLVIEPGKSK